MDDEVDFSGVDKAIENVMAVRMNPNLQRQGDKARALPGRQGLEAMSVMDPNQPRIKGYKDDSDTFGVMLDAAGLIPMVPPGLRMLGKTVEDVLKVRPLASGQRGNIRIPGLESEPGFGLTTKTLDRLPNKDSFNAETVLSTAARPDVSKVERDLITRVMGDKLKINRQELQSKVKEQLLPLKVEKTDDFADYGLDNIGGPSTYGDRDAGELIGVPKEAKTHLWTMPWDDTNPNFVNTNHFQNKPTYFSHTRRFDAPNDYPKVDGPTTRHIVEIQSDLFQKSKTPLSEAERDLLREDHGELTLLFKTLTDKSTPLQEKAKSLDKYKKVLNLTDGAPNYDQFMKLDSIDQEGWIEAAVENTTAKLGELAKKLQATQDLPGRAKGLEKTWYQRTLREENKLAAQEGVETMRVPTGNTVEKVEGWPRHETFSDPSIKGRKVEGIILDGRIRRDADGDSVLMGKYPDGEGTPGYVYVSAEDLPDDLYQLTNSLERRGLKSSGFELSPEHQGLYNFYEQEIKKFATKEFGAKPVTDSNGNTWLEWKVDPSSKDKPIQALSVGAGTAAAASQDPDFSGVDKHIESLRKLRNGSR